MSVVQQRHISEIRFTREEGPTKKTYLVIARHKETGEWVGKIFGSPYSGAANLDVLGSYQRIGIGTQLLNMYIRFVKEETTLSQVKFTCQKTNEKALSLYRKLGFYTQDFGETMYHVILDLKDHEESK